ncbi:hypothetical protein [Escherichia coli]|uniref:hypothetical protein n=1 Tax=Escherichia coli TaxID=562 RepID=UPI003AF210D4
MSFTDIYQISGSAMTAQTIRLNKLLPVTWRMPMHLPAARRMAYKARSPVFVCGGVSPQLAGGESLPSCH